MNGTHSIVVADDCLALFESTSVGFILSVFASSRSKEEPRSDRCKSSNRRGALLHSSVQGAAFLHLLSGPPLAASSRAPGSSVERVKRRFNVWRNWVASFEDRRQRGHRLDHSSSDVAVV
jgi:hypothetical protein